jgi:hypothetical protein
MNSMPGILTYREERQGRACRASAGARPLVVRLQAPGDAQHLLDTLVGPPEDGAGDGVADW